MTQEEMAERLAQAALRGWFNDPDGFRNMRERGNRLATKATLQVLKENGVQSTGEPASQG